MPVVAATPRSFRNTPGPHHERLARAGVTTRFPAVDRPLTEAEMVDLVAGCDALIVGVDPVTDAVLDAAPLRIIAKYGSGTDNIDLGAAQQRGIPVTTTGAANATSVAELAIGLLFVLARRIALHDRSVRGGSWSRVTGVELSGRCLGIIGVGAIGREVARRATCLGMTVVGHDAYAATGPVPLVSLDELLSQADAVTLHVPLSEGTRNLLDAAAIRRMRPGSLLVNTARGGLVDEDALAGALRDGHIAGAALDCFRREPPEGSPLLMFDTVVATPHIGAATTEAVLRMSLDAVEDVLRALGG